MAPDINCPDCNSTNMESVADLLQQNSGYYGGDPEEVTLYQCKKCKNIFVW